MKKNVLSLFLCIMLIFLSGTFVPALADTALPAEVTDALPKNCTVLSHTDGGEFSGKDLRLFVLIRSEKKENVLYCFRQENGKWVRDFFTSSAVPQTGHNMEIFLSCSGYEWPGEEPYSTPRLMINQLDKENEYPELCLTFTLESGKWLLHRVWSYTDYQSMLLKNNAISYYKDIESTTVAGTVRGSFQRDLRWFSLSALPKTLKEARTKITSAPELPRSSGLNAQEISFSGGQKYEVYSAPDKASLRGGNGKAKVSTNGWIQVFGREGGYILIQYSIDKDHYRFGYISEKALPKKASVNELDFTKTPVTITQNVNATDDPLYSRAVIAALKKGDRVTLLSFLGEDAYVEGLSGNTVFRGFVPFSCLAAEEEEPFESFTDASGADYPLFVIDRLNCDEGQSVISVTGHFERIAMDEEGEYPLPAAGSELTLPLAPDFTADMLSSICDLEMNYEQVTDLYGWYLKAYLNMSPDSAYILTFDADLTDEELRSGLNGDFWFVTTRIRLNEKNQIEYMEYVYVPWA